MRLILHRLDSLQQKILSETGISEERALGEFNLAPLSVRRDIAMLGLIHRTVLGSGPAQFKVLFEKDVRSRDHVTRLQKSRHSKQLVEHRGGLEILQRSALGLTSVYNLLPQVFCRS